MNLRLPNPSDGLTAARALLRSGLIGVYRPDRLARIWLGAARYRFGPAVGPIVGVDVYPNEPGVIDDEGRLTMRELGERCSAVASGLSRAGLSTGDAIGLLARNSAALYEVAVGASRLGLDVVYLNCGSSAAQVDRIVERQRLRALVYDREFTNRVPRGVLSICTLPDSSGGLDVAAMVRAPARPLSPPSQPSRHIILTSGTTGAARPIARTGGGSRSVIALLSGLPLRVRETHLIAAPMFHAWGWLHMQLSMLLSSTLVLTRRFEPERVLALVDRERCQVLVAVPAMLRGMLDLPPGVRRRYDTASLRLAVVSGSALPADLAERFREVFGDILYSLYGSTEAGYATVATPADLRAAPGTAGRPLPGVRVMVLDGDGHPCPTGVVGAIHVSGPDAVSGVVRTGDVGWFDAAGRLFVAAREDDMVIVGGENVYPAEVEDVLLRHPDVADAAVVGVPDRALGEILIAHVVPRPGGTVDPAAVRDWCRDRLASFQVPREVVVRRRLPRNETGKVVKRTLVRGASRAKG
jgi:fatty-acyl-CoA synthase